MEREMLLLPSMLWIDFTFVIGQTSMEGFWWFHTIT